MQMTNVKLDWDSGTPCINSELSWANQDYDFTGQSGRISRLRGGTRLGEYTKLCNTRTWNMQVVTKESQGFCNDWHKVIGHEELSSDDIKAEYMASLWVLRGETVAVCDLAFTPANGYAEPWIREFYFQSDKSWILSPTEEDFDISETLCFQSELFGGTETEMTTGEEITKPTCENRCFSRTLCFFPWSSRCW